MSLLARLLRAGHGPSTAAEGVPGAAHRFGGRNSVQSVCRLLCLLSFALLTRRCLFASISGPGRRQVSSRESAGGLRDVQGSGAHCADSLCVCFASYACCPHFSGVHRTPAPFASPQRCVRRCRFLSAASAHCHSTLTRSPSRSFPSASRCVPAWSVGLDGRSETTSTSAGGHTSARLSSALPEGVPNSGSDFARAWARAPQEQRGEYLRRIPPTSFTQLFRVRTQRTGGQRCACPQDCSRALVLASVPCIAGGGHARAPG